MDLLEYQAKELFKQVGIPILPSQTIQDIAELKRLQLPYPLVLKSQVRAGGRGKAGGIKFVENTIDAVAAASTIFHLPIAGEYPEVVLAEARYDSQSEIFLAIVVDYHRCCPVLMGSSRGGIDVDALLDEMESVALREPFSLYHARRLAIKMGLDGPLVAEVSAILEKMYFLFITYDLDMIEINPLGINRDGAVMALDGKIVANDTAIARHSDLQDWHQEALSKNPTQWLEGDNEGKVALICNSYGLALSCWDMLEAQGVYGAYLVDDGRETVPLPVQLEQAFNFCHQGERVAVILVNFALTPDTLPSFVEALQRFFPKVPLETAASDDRSLRGTGLPLDTSHRQHASEWQRQNRREIPLVLRFSRGDLTPWQKRYPSPLSWHHDLKAAIAQVRSLAVSTQSSLESSDA